MQDNENRNRDRIVEIFTNKIVVFGIVVISIFAIYTVANSPNASSELGKFSCLAFTERDDCKATYAEVFTGDLVRYYPYERTTTESNTEVSSECSPGEYLKACVGWILKENGAWEDFNTEPDVYTKDNRMCGTSASPGHSVRIDLFCAKSATTD